MYIRIFFLVSLTLLSILPIINIINNGLPKNTGIKNTIKNIYSIDRIEGCFNKLLFPLGISTNQGQVIIGYDGWLFIGDDYENTITEFRKGRDANNKKSENIANSQLAWDKYFQNRGVEDFKIIIGPNKSTIYSEKVPHWAQSDSSISNKLYENNIYVNSIDQLTESKVTGQIYFSSDTHWNKFGAGVAFEQFIKDLKPNGNFVFPDKNWSEIVNVKEIAGGDLATFLKVQTFIKDSMPTTKINRHVAEHFIYDYNSNELVYQGENTLFGSMHYPYIIYTPNALNQKKVLWLSDSFGTAMAPYMTATFSHILKRHWEGVVGTQLLEELVNDWKPDYIFYTVVERSSLSNAFLNSPPIQLETTLELDDIGVNSNPKLHSINSEGNSTYSVFGQDPYLVYDFEKKVLLNNTDQYRINFNLDCQNSSENIPIQVFWHSTGGAFNESQSIQFNAINGNNQVILHALSSINDIVSFRIDLDKSVTCNRFSMKDVHIGSVASEP